MCISWAPSSVCDEGGECPKVKKKPIKFCAEILTQQRQTGGDCILHFPLLSAVSFPGCWCVFPSCSPLGQQHVLEEVKCVLKLVYGFIYFVLTSSGFLWLQTDWHMAVYLSCGVFWTIYIWGFFSLKTVHKGLFGGFCLFLSFFVFNKTILYVFTLVNFATLFIFPVTKMTFFWIIVFFVF